jgi:hypothetical protein
MQHSTSPASVRAANQGYTQDQGDRANLNTVLLAIREARLILRSLRRSLDDARLALLDLDANVAEGEAAQKKPASRKAITTELAQ